MLNKYSYFVIKDLKIIKKTILYNLFIILVFYILNFELLILIRIIIILTIIEIDWKLIEIEKKMFKKLNVIKNKKNIIVAKALSLSSLKLCILFVVLLISRSSISIPGIIVLIPVVLICSLVNIFVVFRFKSEIFIFMILSLNSFIIQFIIFSLVFN